MNKPGMLGAMIALGMGLSTALGELGLIGLVLGLIVAPFVVAMAWQIRAIVREGRR